MSEEGRRRTIRIDVDLDELKTLLGGLSWQFSETTGLGCDTSYKTQCLEERLLELLPPGEERW